jgi:hypothetical protein
MKTKIIWCLLLLALRLHGVDAAPDVMHISLDSSNLVRIPVAIDRVTTVRFPAPISGLEAAFISQEPSLLSRFHLSYQNGSRYFSLRALTTGVRANLNVVVGREIYALEFVESNRPVYVVEFAPALDKVQNPAVAGLVHIARPESFWKAGDCTAGIIEVIRFDPEDTLIFAISFYNDSERPMFYDLDRVGVKVGTEVYYASQCDGNGLLPANTHFTLHLVVTGKPGGGRNDLAVTNAFVPHLESRRSRSEDISPVFAPSWPRSLINRFTFHVRPGINPVCDAPVGLGRKSQMPSVNPADSAGADRSTQPTP